MKQKEIEHKIMNEIQYLQNGIEWLQEDLIKLKRLLKKRGLKLK